MDNKVLVSFWCTRDERMMIKMEAIKRDMKLREYILYLLDADSTEGKINKILAAKNGII